MNTFTNPYINGDPSLNLSKDDTHSRRVTYSVHREDKEFIKTIRPTMGTETTAMTILYHKLVVACKARGIIDLTHSKAFEDFVAGLVLVEEKEVKVKKVKKGSAV